MDAAKEPILTQEIRFESDLESEAVVRTLRSALSSPGSFAEQLFPTKVKLAGTIDPPNVTLYRDRGGRHWFLRFEGSVVSEHDKTVLRGRMVNQPPGTVSIGIGFMFFIASIAGISAIFDWRGLESLGIAVIGVVAVSLAFGVIWFRAKNREAERGFLVDDIKNALGRPDA